MKTQRHDEKVHVETPMIQSLEVMLFTLYKTIIGIVRMTTARKVVTARAMDIMRDMSTVMT